MKWTSIGLTLFLCMSTRTAISGVYGEDNRAEPYEKTLWFEASRSVMAQVSNAMLTPQAFEIPGGTTNTLKSVRGLCEGERFADQPTFSRCSGFLVAPDVVMTAGHCMKSQEYCDGASWVLGYEMDEVTGQPKKILKENVYRCKKILAQSYGDGKADYAVIQLDRKTDQEPLPLMEEGEIAPVGTNLVLMGFPSWLPLKIADNAQVLGLANKKLLTNLDAFGGNSGGVVLDEKTGTVAGILSSGAKDYVKEGNCNVVNTYLMNYGGEKVTPIGLVPRSFME